jgi:hypothetical protein
VYPGILAYLSIKIAGRLLVDGRRIIGGTLQCKAHLNAGDGGSIPAVIGLVLLPISFFTQNYARSGVSTCSGMRFGVAA